MSFHIKRINTLLSLIYKIKKTKIMEQVTTLRSQLEGFKLDWLASQVRQPTGIVGMNVFTFYTYVYKPLDKTPHWLIKELSRITGREIKNQKSA